jgi:hydroxymethylpyrimidine/phosphomethylpyrimidine kinase
MLILSLSLEAKSNKSKVLISCFYLQNHLRYDSVLATWGCLLSAVSVPSGPASRTLLTVAGHDPSNGAGITADLLTFASHRLFGTSVLTALTVQSTLGVAAIHPVVPSLLERALENLVADLPPSGIKIGMLGSAENATTVATFLARLPKEKGREVKPPVVLDPILQASSGADLLPRDAIQLLHNRLLPVVSWTTPNWSELAALTDLPVSSIAEAETAAHALAERHPHLHIVATAGGHPQSTDILRLPSGEIHRFAGEHIKTTATHGTGCAFSSALLCHLVQRDTPIEAVRSAKHFVTEAIRRAPKIGHGTGPLNLIWRLS